MADRSGRPCRDRRWLGHRDRRRRPDAGQHADQRAEQAAHQAQAEVHWRHRDAEALRAALQADLRDDGDDPETLRVLLADAADRSIDIQTYIWHPDATGLLVLDAVRRAAGRGVRVRLLIDDNSTAGMDALLAMLESATKDWPADAGV